MLIFFLIMCLIIFLENIGASFIRSFGSLLMTKELSGGHSPPLKKKDMLRALPLKPTKVSAFGIRKPLKRLDLNFKCLGEVC